MTAMTHQIPLAQTQHRSPAVSFALPTLGIEVDDSEGQFLFARIKGDICLVQLTHQDPSSSTLDISFFRHEFISIFRYSHCARVQVADVRILESLHAHDVRYEEDSGTVFLAKDLVARLRKMTDANMMVKAGRGRPVPGRRRS
ncbi:hypothetical protein BJ138DRAFT_1154223 [Hygrophoropsis aurantiaca]|uniref:Uncharacterized protein n=1 Tax=Hygrophoropsis aurantiaca TaxID=72124 RepID=A0ACB8A8R9_9AGAM|nr:hypothetical protein BJ138DRAFT_1154223 [Hygrophoropsis aurantiaca]